MVTENPHGRKTQGPRRSATPRPPHAGVQRHNPPEVPQLPQLQAALENIQDGLLVLDKGWHYIYVNPAAAALLKTTPDQLVGKVVWETFPKAPPSRFHEGFTRAAGQSIFVKFEAFYEPLGRWYECRCHPTRDGLTVFLTETTSHGQTEETLRCSEAILAHAGQMANLGAWEIEITNRKDLNDNPLHWSEQVYRIFGYEPGSVPVTNDLFFRHVHPDDRESITDAVAQALAERRPYEIEHRIIRPDGTERTVREHADLKFDKEGRPLRMIGAVQDITERKQAERSLRESEQRFRAVLENSLDVAYRRDVRNDRYDYISPVVQQTTGFTPAEMNELTVAEVFARIHPEDVERVRKELVKAMADGQGTIEYRFRCKDSTYRWLADYFVVQKDKAGRPLYLSGSVRNITGLKQAEEALRQSEQRFKSTFENAAVGITHMGLDGRFLRYNRRFCEITGYDEAELAGKTFQELTHPDDLKAEMSRRERLQRGEIARYLVEKRYVRKDGTVLWVNLTVSAQRDDEGRIEYFIAIVQDISRRKQIEELLRDNEQRLRLALEGAHMGRWEWDIQTDRTFRDERVSELLGVDKRDPATHETLMDRVDERDRSLLRELLQRALAEQEDFQAEFRVVHPGGEILWLALHGRVLRDEQGQAVRMMGVMYDVTQRKRMEDDLRRLNDQLEGEVSARTEQLRSAIDRLHDEVPRRVLAEGRLRRRSQMLEAFFQHTIAPLAFLDRDFNFVRVNEAFAGGDGKDPDFFVGKNLFALCPPAGNRAVFERVVQTKQPYRAYAVPYAFPDVPQRKRGATFWNWWLTPLLDDRGEVQFLVWSLEDVSEQQKAMQELQERARQLQQLTLELSEAEDRERQRLAEILHDDLQQMLAAAKFHLGLLSNRARGNQELVEMAGQIKEMLKDAIEKSRNLSHELSPPGLAHSDLGEALEWLAQQMQAKHGLTVHLDTCDRVELASEPLKSFLYKAAQEVLFNVIKHARVKEARLRLRRRRGRVYLSVADKGQGFDAQTPDKMGRFGLLTIRERVKLLGGRMKIRSTRGKGSVLLIAVPYSEPRKDQQGGQDPEGTEQGVVYPEVVVPAPPGRILRVLLADDHRIVRQGLESMLADEPDIEVVGQAGNGREAVDLTDQLRPDVVVMDVAMPVMAGDEATRQIKLHLPQTRVIALSMFDDARVAEKMRRAGAVAYLLKTAPSEDLLAAIRGTHPAAARV